MAQRLRAGFSLFRVIDPFGLTILRSEEVVPSGASAGGRIPRTEEAR